MDPVQVFVEPIQQERQQLLGVLLLEAIKPRRVLRYRPLERKTLGTRELVHPYIQMEQIGSAGRGGGGGGGLTRSFSGATLFWVPLHSSITKSP